MRVRSRAKLAIISTFLISIATNSHLIGFAATNSLAVGSIRNPSLLKIQGTFCDLHLISDRQKRDIFLSAYQSQLQSKALMNIDGKDTILTSVHEVKNARGAIATYRAGNLNVKVNYIRTSPENEGASYDATISITSGRLVNERRNQTKILKVTGACGI